MSQCVVSLDGSYASEAYHMQGRMRCWWWSTDSPYSSVGEAVPYSEVLIGFGSWNLVVVHIKGLDLG